MKQDDCTQSKISFRKSQLYDVQLFFTIMYNSQGHLKYKKSVCEFEQNLKRCFGKIEM